MTRLALDYAMKMRRDAAEHLAEEDHKREDYPETLAAFRDSGLFTVAEIADIIGLSTSRTYALLATADERKRP